MTSPHETTAVGPPADHAADDLWSPLAEQLALSIVITILRRAQRGTATPLLLREAERLVMRLAEQVRS
jgi:hypothetical protein